MGLPLMLIPCHTSSKVSMTICCALCAFLVLDYRSRTICMMIKQSTEYLSVFCGHARVSEAAYAFLLLAYQVASLAKHSYSVLG